MITPMRNERIDKEMFYGASPEIFRRDYEMEKLGLKVIRFTNNQINYNIAEVISKIETNFTPASPP
ncbi:MAG: DUF559 domain-containing protein [Bacteroidales bacterium]|nr:DUF559 domain-containing protein [Bacteroidales bacterium]